MAGTRLGGLRARDTNRQRYGGDYYEKIGAAGGKKISDRPKGFAYSAANGLDWHRKAGQRGGTKSRRTKKEAV